MRITMTTRGHIILLFIISSSFLFPHSSAAAPSSTLSKLLDKAKDAFRMDNVADYLKYFKEYGPDKSKELPSDVQDTIDKVQKAYGRPVTGNFDATTESFVNRSRCGVPEYSLVLSLLKRWPRDKKELTYVFLNVQKVKAPLNDKAVFSRSFARWENVTGLSFSETASFDGSDIVIAFVNMNETNVVGVSLQGNANKRVMIFEVDEEWGPVAGGMAAGEVDFETAVMHQIGHMVGLGHTTLDESAVMFPFMDNGKRKLDYGGGEKSRIQNLFGITSNSDTSSGDSTSTGKSTSTAGSAGSVGPAGWVLSLAIFVLMINLNH